MTVQEADRRLSTPETLDLVDLNAAKRRRSSRLSAEIAKASPPSPAGDIMPEPFSTARKLTKSQRATLIRVISLEYYIPAIRETLAAEHPEIPQVSDQLLRYYRLRIDEESSATVMEEARAARRDALRVGLANKSTRIRSLIRQVEQLQRVPLVEQAIYLDDKGQPQPIYRVRESLSKELRELKRQIAQELGQLAPIVPSGAYEPLEPAEDDLADDADLRGAVEGMLRSIAENDAATEVALRGAARTSTREN